MLSLSMLSYYTDYLSNLPLMKLITKGAPSPVDIPDSNITGCF